MMPVSRQVDLEMHIQAGPRAPRANPDVDRASRTSDRALATKPPKLSSPRRVEKGPPLAIKVCTRHRSCDPGRGGKPSGTRRGGTKRGELKRRKGHAAPRNAAPTAQVPGEEGSIGDFRGCLAMAKDPRADFLQSSHASWAARAAGAGRGRRGRARREGRASSLHIQCAFRGRRLDACCDKTLEALAGGLASLCIRGSVVPRVTPLVVCSSLRLLALSASENA